MVRHARLWRDAISAIQRDRENRAKRTDAIRTLDQLVPASVEATNAIVVLSDFFDRRQPLYDAMVDAVRIWHDGTKRGDRSVVVAGAGMIAEALATLDREEP